MIYDRGDIVVVPFPLILPAGQRTRKARPALVISDTAVARRYDELILAGITSRIAEDIKITEVVLEASAENGLATTSIVRLEFLMTVPSELISRKIGILTPEEMALIDHTLAISLGLAI